MKGFRVSGRAMRRGRRSNGRVLTVLRVVMGLGFVGAFLLLQRPEAELPPHNPKFPPFYPNWPESARRFMNGGLYRGLIGFLYDMGVRKMHVGESYRQIWDAKASQSSEMP
jgi:hypothetical protein